MKVCKNGHTMDESNVYIYNGYKRCQACIRVSRGKISKAYKKAANHKLALKRAHWTLEQYNAALIEQRNACAICIAPFESFPKGPCADHAHDNGSSRGLLCSTCNSGLGMFKDNPTLLELAADYLRNYRK